MPKHSMAAALSSLRRNGTRLLGMTARLLAVVAPKTTGTAAKPAKPRAAAKKQPALRKSDGVRRKAPPVPKPSAVPKPSVNPGGLTMHIHAPATARSGAPLVVLLHGCGQDPEEFATQTGWRELADSRGYVLLMPGQTEANNRQRCFNWFRPGDTGRDLGEAGSIVAMVAAAIKAHRCDPARVFVTGLSAGAAMTSCLLAAYPDVFAGGGVVAGLPAGAASGVVGAMTRMAGHGGDLSAAEWMGRARALAPIGYGGTWPLLSVWSGDADTVVAPRNSGHLAQQWTTLLGLPSAPAANPPDALHQRWGRDGERVWVESRVIPGMGHIYPTVRDGGVSAAREIAAFWGIA